ncbi:zinc finger protein 541 isoform X2 [Trichomycterus rosablanca]|uniref:zinc finger protein 541 isoform X2 n=1 Tax=Trichomycterus rosablanca TaxID=2290929 RepID=UPI002F34F6B5
MAEDQVCPITSDHHVMEAIDPSDENVPLLSGTENLPHEHDMILISPLNAPLPPLPALEQHQLWIDAESEDSKGPGSSIKDTDPLFGNDLVSTEVMQTVTVHKQKCLECFKVFRTTNALNKHLLTHQSDRPHVCNICKQGFKRHDHLTGHLLIHQRRNAYLCTHPGCQKTYYDHRSLKRHCASQHTVYPGFSSVAGNLGLCCYSEEPNLMNITPSVSPDVWGLGAAGAFRSLENPVDVTASHSTLMSNQWPLSLSNVVDQFESNPEIKVWENSRNIPGTNLKVSESKMESRVFPGCPEKSQSSTSKHSLWQVKPHSKQQDSLINDAMPCAGSNHDASLVAQPGSSNGTDFHTAPTQDESKTRKMIVKKTLKAVNIPTPPLPSPRLITQRRPRPRPASLVSPSQVALESFSKDGALFHTNKGGSAAAVKENTRQSGSRTYLKYPCNQHAASSSSLSQAPPSICAELDQGARVDRDDDRSQESDGVQLSPLIMPVSVPVSNQIKMNQNTESPTETCHQSGLSPHQSRERELGIRATGGYPSQLRSPSYLADRLLNLHLPPYTPQPMLSPLRPGTGLYFNTLPQCQPYLPPSSTHTASVDRKEGISLMMDNTVVSIKPRINVGSCFQAEIPPLRNPLLMLYDEHPAQLIWTPWGDLPTNPETQKRVEAFLDLCCSSVLPGGGTNTELALHCLHEVQGDILAALDLLLMRGDYRTSCHPLSDYHYTGSDRWSAQEIRLFRKALVSHNKDFQQIQKMLQTKSVVQCVEYYYATKKLKKFKRRSRADKTGGTEEQCESKTGIRKSLNRPKGTNEDQSAQNREYTCEECGRCFDKVKSRSAHMKAHRQQERERSCVDSWREQDRLDANWGSKNV